MLQSVFNKILLQIVFTKMLQIVLTKLLQSVLTKMLQSVSKINIPKSLEHHAQILTFQKICAINPYFRGPIFRRVHGMP